MIFAKIKDGDYTRFLSALFLFAFAAAIVNSILNNFLNETFSMTDFARGFLELPRELPGFLVAFVSAAFFFLSVKHLASLSHFLAAAGVFLIGHFSSSYEIMLVWLFTYSMGQHLFFPLISSMGMSFAEDGHDGKKLGQINALNNIATIAGSAVIFVGFRFLNFDFGNSFTIAAIVCLISSLFLFSIKKERTVKAKTKLVFRKEYSFYYWLCVLFGTRKQLFLTFAPWVIVTIFGKETAVIAQLMTIGGIIGIGFNPILGRFVDKMGERFIFICEALLLVLVCLGYAFSSALFSADVAFIIVAACFITDQLLMSVNMARSTYMKKIALFPEDITGTLTMGVTIDHIFSITIAIMSGFVWSRLGYQYVFIIGAFIASLNLISAFIMRAPEK
ncbi:MAG: MFS transporter [Leptospirales bacterium]|nr:MFS transporter [Leptospirales bacterium]